MVNLSIIFMAASNMRLIFDRSYHASDFLLRKLLSGNVTIKNTSVPPTEYAITWTGTTQINLFFNVEHCCLRAAMIWRPQYWAFTVILVPMIII